MWEEMSKEIKRWTAVGRDMRENTSNKLKGALKGSGGGDWDFVCGVGKLMRVEAYRGGLTDLVKLGTLGWHASILG